LQRQRLGNILPLERQDGKESWRGMKGDVGVEAFFRVGAREANKVKEISE
jgi:hypothetical protein